MTPMDCRAVRAALDEIVAGEPALAAHLAHLETCTDCQAELAWARRIDRVLTTWPTPAPPTHFASTVAAAARRETWRQEQVLDWGFNVALGVGLGAIAAGLGGLVWMVGVSAGTDGVPRVAVSAANTLLATVRGQGQVVALATGLLVTTLGAWWWAEERARW